MVMVEQLSCRGIHRELGGLEVVRCLKDPSLSKSPLARVAAVTWDRAWLERECQCFAGKRNFSQGDVRQVL